KRTSTQVKYGYLMVLTTFIQAICEGRCGRLVYDTANSQPGDFTCFFGSLALCVVKICRYRDYGFGHFLAQVIFSGLFHFLKDHGGNFLGGIKTSVYVNTYGIIVTLYHFIAPMTDFFGHLIKAASHKTF